MKNEKFLGLITLATNKLQDPHQIFSSHWDMTHCLVQVFA